MSSKLSAICYYVALSLLILGWWYWAFQAPYESSEIPKIRGTALAEAPKGPPPVLELLTPIDRQALQNALGGDFSLMAKLIAEWDIDAEILDSRGIKGVKRLDRPAFTRSQIIGRQILTQTKETLNELNSQSRAEAINDDNDAWISLKTAYGRFLPQTYVSASFLLALADPGQIVALPRGLRNQEMLYPAALTGKISLDVDRFNSEKIFLAAPQVAFIAYYSHPSTVQALKNQGVQLFTTKSIDTVADIQNALARIGHVINKPLEAELMKIFMEASMLAIDNWVQAHRQYWDEYEYSPRVLYLTYYTQFSSPATKTLTGQLLQRLGFSPQENYCSGSEAVKDWMVPVDREKIIHCHPDCLLISTPKGEVLKRQFDEDPGFAAIASACGKKIFFLDEAVQQSSSQYIVLAYYDIAKAIMGLGLL